MKKSSEKSIEVGISQSCKENWHTFEHAVSSSFCQNCQKNVIDFTQFSDDAIVAYFQKAKGSTCGRFRADQLKIYQLPKVHFNTSFKYLRSSIAACLLLFLSQTTAMAGSKASHQDKNWMHLSSVTHHPSLTLLEEDHFVSGVVVDEYSGEFLAGVNITLKGTNVGVVTDLDGYFKFPQKLTEGDVLVFSFIGMERQEYVVSKSADETIEIRLEMAYHILMGEVNIAEADGRNNKLPQASLWQRIASWF